MNKQLTKSTVILATYNGSEYIRETLASISAQTYTNLELVLVDDCSTDNTVSILEQFANQNPSLVSVIKRNNQNKGFVKTFLEGLDASNGEFISLFGQDDIMLPNRMSALVEAMELESVSMVCSNAYFLYGEQKTSKLVRPTQRTNGELKKFKFLYTNPVIGPSVLFKKQDFFNIDRKEVFRFRQSMEWAHWFQYTGMSGIFYLAEPLLFYRRHENNLSGHIYESPEFKEYKAFCQKQISEQLSVFEKTLAYYFFTQHRVYAKLFNPNPNKVN